MQYATAVYWNRGSVAACNQDSLTLQQVLTGRGRVLMAAVCDGMGGLQQGEAASGYMTERLQEWFYGSLMRLIHKKKPYWIIRRSLDRIVYHVQEQMRQYAGRERLDMGTTMSLLVLWEDIYLIWHLGDSRIYRIRSKRRFNRGDNRKSGKHGIGKHGMPEPMTTDHVQGRNRLTKCVGSFGYFRPDYRMGALKKGDAFLLCSDGFYHCVTNQELADILCPVRLLEERQMERRLAEIGTACMKRGERDNLSAIYIRVE